MPINLNILNSSDTQCTHHQSGLLCGQCEPGRNLSYGTSHCLSHPKYTYLWPVAMSALFIIILGVILVAVLMFLNMTVAVETISGLIFYSNIVGIGGDAFPLANFVSGLTSLFNVHVHNKILFLCRNGHVLENMASVGIPHILDSSCYFHNSLKSTLHEILLIDCQEKSRRNTGYSNPTLIHYTFL